MNKAFSGGLAMALSFIFLLPAGAQKVERVGGVAVVSNSKKPNPPRGGSGRIELIEELMIGKGDNPYESFSEVGAFVVDAEGTVFGLDFKDCNIKVFDKKGAFLRLIGKKGQGPGELGVSSGIMMTSDHQILVVDISNRRLTFFKRTGEFSKSVSTSERMGLSGLILDHLGGYIGQEMGLALDNVRMFYEIKKYDKDLNPLFTIDRVEFPIPLPGYGVKLNPMEIIFAFRADKDGRIYCGRSADYAIKVYNREGKHIKTIKKEYDRTKITQADIEDMLALLDRSSGFGGVDPREVMSFPDFFPPFSGFLLDDRGHLFVYTYTKGKAKGEYGVDVFDGEGRFIAQFFTKSRLHLIRGDKAYGIEEDEDGFRVIKRYSLIWK